MLTTKRQRTKCRVCVICISSKEDTRNPPRQRTTKAREALHMKYIRAPSAQRKETNGGNHTYHVRGNSVFIVCCMAFCPLLCFKTLNNLPSSPAVRNNRYAWEETSLRPPPTAQPALAGQRGGGSLA
jgi:hypothetical protein